MSSVSSYRRQSVDPAESLVQKGVFQHLRLRGAFGLVAFAVPNGGWRSRTEAAIMSGMGVMPGVPDVLLFHCGKSYGLELKRLDGRVSAAQLEMHSRLRSAGMTVATAYGFDDALRHLQAWQLLRGASAS